MRAGWTMRAVNDLAYVSRGRSRHRPRNEPALYGGEYPFIQTADVHSADLYITNCSQTYSEKGLQQSRLWEPGTICITIAGENTGDCAILGIRACFPDSVVGVVADPMKADTTFLKYAIDRLRPQLRKITRGATQDNLSIAKLLAFTFPTPPVTTQRRIGEFLRNYGDLIDDNRRRIALLEEAARQLYREWFVRSAFPATSTPESPTACWGGGSERHSASTWFSSAELNLEHPTTTASGRMDWCGSFAWEISGGAPVTPSSIPHLLRAYCSVHRIS